MRATGIVRRIDDLGRVVIPKEIRRTLRIRESDPLEIFTDREGEIILKKYSPIGELGTFAKEYAEALAHTLNCLICITDQDQIVAASGSSSKEYLGKKISKELEEVISKRESRVITNGAYIRVTEGEEVPYTSQAVHTITSSGDAIGSVLLLYKEPGSAAGDADRKIAAVAADFLGRQMES
ncbi:MAG: stage V sporulation protein T [Lachnospiraceae bacterium]|jgi:AbrB family transcriptional regulator (stage V sporulation protein T)